jgi:hypothetical protein
MDQQSSGAPEGFFSRLVDLGFRALPAIGSAIGFVGFVALIGGAIEWIRFDSIGLPANQAVHAIPRSELVVDGAWALSLFIILGLLAILVAFLGRRGGFGRAGWGFIFLALAEALAVAYMVGRSAALWRLAIWLSILALAAWYAFDKLNAQDRWVNGTRRHALRRLATARKYWEDTKQETAEAADVLQRLTDGGAPQEIIVEAQQQLATSLRAHLRAEARWQRVITSVRRRYGAR